MARYENVSCSQCGRDFGPGDHGYSHCQDHRPNGWVTERPWKFVPMTSRREDSADGFGYIRPADEDGREIAHYGDADRSRSENIANAAFIVRAVNCHDDLLAALKFVADITGEELEHAQVGTGAEVALRHANRRASAAITKASGEA
jgi:hypothetical protein